MYKKSKGSTHTNPLNDSCYQLIKLTTKANRHMRFEIVSRDSLHSYSFMTSMDASFQLVVAWRQARKVASLWKIRGTKRRLIFWRLFSQLPFIRVSWKYFSSGRQFAKLLFLLFFWFFSCEKLSTAYSKLDKATFLTSLLRKSSHLSRKTELRA